MITQKERNNKLSPALNLIQVHHGRVLLRGVAWWVRPVG